MINLDVSAFGHEKTVKDSFQAYLVEGAQFTDCEEYPIIREDMVSRVIPKRIMPFSKAICYRGDLSDTFICTYSPDETFERVRQHPKRYLSFFKRTAGLIGFDFSIHSDMPLVKQKAQMNDNLSLSYYYGNNGIPIIPNIRCGIDELASEFLSAIPKHTLVAVGTHGFCKEINEKYEWYCFIETVIKELHPSGIIVYGSLYGKMFDEIKDQADFIFYDPWIKQRYKEVKNNVD